MKLYYILNNEGFIVSYNYYEEPPLENSTDVLVNKTFIKPKFNGIEWIEGASEEEILLSREIPEEVPLWALKIILSEMNIINNVINAFNLLEEPTKSRVNFVWEYGNSVERNSNTVNFIKSVLNLSDITLDTIFIEASKIKL